MRERWIEIRDQIEKQLGPRLPFVGLAGAVSAGKIKLRLVSEAAAGDEFYGMLTPFVPAVDAEGVWIDVGGKPYLLGSNGRAAGPRLYSGSGSPEGVVTAEIGSVYLRNNGASGTTFYSKGSGSGNTGWEALGAAPPQDWRFGAVMRSMAPYLNETGVALTVAHALTHGYQETGSSVDVAFDVNAPGCWAVYNTAASTNSDAGWDLGAATPLFVHTNWAPLSLECRYQSGGTLTSGRWWIGAFSATPMASDDPAVSGFGFRYAPATDGTAYWRTWTNDGSGGGTVTTTTVAMSSNTAYTLRVDVVSTSEIRFYINGALVATHTTNLPGSTTDLTPRCMVRTLNTTVKSVRWAWLHIRHS